MKRLVARAVLALAILIGWFAVGGSMPSVAAARAAAPSDRMAELEGSPASRGGSAAPRGGLSGVSPVRPMPGGYNRYPGVPRTAPGMLPDRSLPSRSSLPVCARQPVCTGHNAFHESRCAAGRTHYFQPAHALPTPHAVYRVQPSSRAPTIRPVAEITITGITTGAITAGTITTDGTIVDITTTLAFISGAVFRSGMAGDTLIFPVTCTIQPTTATTRTTTTPPRSLVTIPPPVPTIRRPIE